MGLETDRTGTPFSLADFALEQHPAKLLRARKAGRSSRRRSVMRSVCDAELASAGAARRRGRCTTTRRRRCNMGSDGSHCWPQGWHSSALSWWCSTCCSCTPRRRTRCCSHRSPSTLAHSATRSQAALRGWQEAGRRCFWTSSPWPSSGRAAAWRHAGARAVHPVPASVCAGAQRGCAHEVRTAVDRRAWCPLPPGRAVQIHCRASQAPKPLGRL